MKRKIKNLKHSFIVMLFLFTIADSCKKEKAASTTVTDVDGNLYHTVIIGTQTWMVENLKTTKYNDGTNIPSITDYAQWAALSTPGYCWYNNDASSNKSTYGALYNWLAVNDGKLCPTGWHVPSDSDWTVLTTYLGGESVAGDKLKETGTNHWQVPNTGATNESGFTGLPGGFRDVSGAFLGITLQGSWWSSTNYNTSDAWGFYLQDNASTLGRGSGGKQGGASVRCLKN